jgi:hypothetical protein
MALPLQRKPDKPGISTAQSPSRCAALSALASEAIGNPCVTDRHAIRKISPQGAATAIAGMQEGSGSTDRSLVAGRFKRPLGIAVDGFGNVYVRPREITPSEK